MQATVLRSPQFLPDGRRFLFHAEGTEPGIYVGDLGSAEEPRRILNAEAARYASSGHLLFVRQGTLFTQTFDSLRLALTGNPTAIAERIVTREATGAALSVSAVGSVVYRAGSSAAQSQFVWFDRSGKALGIVAGSDIGSGFNSSLSPDERRLAMTRNVGQAPSDIWLLDLDRGVPIRFTTDEAFDLVPVWSPNGKWIAFSSNRMTGDRQHDPYIKPADGIEDETVLETERPALQATGPAMVGSSCARVSVARRTTTSGSCRSMFEEHFHWSKRRFQSSKRSSTSRTGSSHPTASGSRISRTNPVSWRCTFNPFQTRHRRPWSPPAGASRRAGGTTDGSSSTSRPTTGSWQYRFASMPTA